MLLPIGSRALYNLLIITQGDALGYGLTVLSGLFQVDSQFKSEDNNSFNSSSVKRRKRRARVIRGFKKSSLRYSKPAQRFAEQFVKFVYNPSYQRTIIREIRVIRGFKKNC